MRELCKVLIVDDEMLIRQGIINYIDWESEGFQVVGEASNGKEAMQLIAERSPHIVITDIVMPIMDGIDLVRAAKKAFPRIEMIVLSSFENFDYVRSTFQNGVADYILKPKLNSAELMRILTKVVSRIPELQHTITLEKPVRSTEEMLESLLAGFDFSLEQAMLSERLTNGQLVLVDVYGESLNPHQLQAVLSQADAKELSPFLVSSSETEASFLFNSSAQQLTSIIEVVTQASVNNPETKWMVHEPVAAIPDMKQVFDEGRSRMKKYAFYLPEQNLFVYDQLPKEKDKQNQFDLNHFIDLFKDRLFASAFSYLETHIEYLAGRYNNDSFEFKSFLGNIVFNVIVLLETMKYDTTDLEQKKYRYFSTINEAAQADRAWGQFNQFLDEVRAIMHSGDKSGEESSNLDKILGYIEQHYTQPLRLAEIANHFHFNASYLSSYFSTHHKEGFSEYLNRVRVKKSMELLANSTVSISVISGMVGYSEPSYFCKVFKRTTGMSPSSYRKELQIHNEQEKFAVSSRSKQ